MAKTNLQQKIDLENLRFSLNLLVDAIDDYLEDPSKENFMELQEDYARVTIYVERIRTIFPEEDLIIDLELVDNHKILKA